MQKIIPKDCDDYKDYDSYHDDIDDSYHDDIFSILEGHSMMMMMTMLYYDTDEGKKTIIIIL